MALRHHNPQTPENVKALSNLAGYKHDRLTEQEKGTDTIGEQAR